MTGHDDFDRTLAGWFEADALSPAPAGGLDRVLDATRRRRPRPAWLAGPGSHWVGEAPDAGSSSGVRSLPRMGMRWSTALILLLVIAAIVGGAILVGALLVRPSPLPTGRLGHLAYGLDGDIYLADWDGGNPVRIADGAPGGAADGCGSNWGEGPMWSPDGRHFAYRSASADRCGGIVAITDPVTKSVASFPGEGWRVSWSPDSTRVASWIDLGKTIGIYGFDGGRQGLLTMPTGCALRAISTPSGRPMGRRSSSPAASCRSTVAHPAGSANDPRSNFTVVYSRDGLSAGIHRLFRQLGVARGRQGRRHRASGPRRSAQRIQWIRSGPAYQNPVLSLTGDRVAFVWSPAFYDEASDPSLIINDLRDPRGRRGQRDSDDACQRERWRPPRGHRILTRGDRVLFSRSDVDYAGTSLESVQIDGSDPQVLVTGTGWGDWQTLPAGP